MRRNSSWLSGVKFFKSTHPREKENLLLCQLKIIVFFSWTIRDKNSLCFDNKKERFTLHFSIGCDFVLDWVGTPWRSGWVLSCVRGRCVASRCCFAWRCVSSRDTGRGCLDVAAVCERGGWFRSRTDARSTGTGASYLKGGHSPSRVKRRWQNRRWIIG